MSRAASAYALREEIDLFEDSPEPPSSKPMRVLGTGSKGYMGPVEELLPLYAPRAVAAYQPPTARYELPASGPLAAPDESISYYAYANSLAIEGPSADYLRARVSRLLVGGLLGLAAVSMLMLVAPALAHSGPPGLRLSSYRDVAAGSAVGAKAENGAPIIDVTSGQPAPDGLQQPQSAPANVVISTRPAASAYALEGPPTLSVRQIEAVLREYGSPAAGSGQKMYDLGIKYGINPAFALAFFVHESGCGTQGVARFSKSLGNIRWTEGFDNYEGYRSYSSWAAGIEDWYALIKTLYIEGWGLRTVDAIIPTYAPAADRNDPAAYIASVKQLVDSWRGK